MSVSNAQLMSALWLNGTNSYQQRIPSPSVASTAQQFNALWEPGNMNFRNEFIDGLINRVGLSYVRNQGTWANPLGPFKKSRVTYGNSVLEAQAKLVAARAYSDSRETLLKVHRPEIAQCVHTVDRFDQYPISINHMELRRAATEEFGLNNFVAAVMDAVTTSEAWDEYSHMLQLISWYEDKLGFYKIHGAKPVDEATSKAFLQSVREIAGLLQFPSGKYMAQNQDIQESGLTTWARPSELVVLMEPATRAAIDVQALSAAFQLPYSEIEQRIVLVDSLPIPDAYAMITTEDWFQVYDQVYDTGSFYNPETLTTQYYLTVTQIISCSPFVPAIIWTTAEGTEDGTVTMTTTNELTARKAIRSGCSGCFEEMPVDTKLTKAMVTGKRADGSPNDINGVYLFAELDGSLSDGTVSGAQELDGVTVRPDAYTVRDIRFSGAGAPVKNSRTYVDALGRLHLQAGAYKGTEDLTLSIDIVPTYVNPSGDTPAPVATTVTFTIAAAGGDEPEPGHHDGADFVTFLYVNPVTGTGVTLSQEQLRDNPSAAFDETAGGALSSVMFLPATGDDLPAVTAASVTITAGEKTATKAASFAYDTWNARDLENDITAEDYEAAGGEATVAVTITAGGEDYTVTVPVTIEAVPVPLTGPDFINEVTVTPVAVGATEATISQADLIAGTASASFDTTAGGAISAVSFEPVGGDLPEITEARLDLTVGGQLTQLPMYPTVGSDDWTVSGIDSSISAADIAAAGGAISATIVLTAGGTVYSDIHFALSVAAIPVNPFESVKFKKDGVTVATVDMTVANWAETLNKGSFDSIVLEDLPAGTTAIGGSYMQGTSEMILNGTVSGTTGTFAADNVIDQYSTNNVLFSYTVDGERTLSEAGAITIVIPLFSDGIVHYYWDTDVDIPFDATQPNWAVSGIPSVTSLSVRIMRNGDTTQGDLTMHYTMGGVNSTKTLVDNGTYWGPQTNINQPTTMTNVYFTSPSGAQSEAGTITIGS